MGDLPRRKEGASTGPWQPWHDLVEQAQALTGKFELLSSYALLAAWEKEAVQVFKLMLKTDSVARTVLDTDPDPPDAHYMAMDAIEVIQESKDQIGVLLRLAEVNSWLRTMSSSA